MKKRNAILLITALLVFLPLNPSFAGSGSDGVVTATWKDIKKSKAKNCTRQKINFTHDPNLNVGAHMMVRFFLYDNEDVEVLSGAQIFSKNNPKTSSALQFCESPGKGPYYLNIQWNHYGDNGRPVTGEFDIPYKFKR